VIIIDSPKKILFIVDNFIPFDSRVWQEAKCLKEVGYDVSIICQHKDNQNKGLSVEEGINVYRINKSVKFGGILGYAWEYSYWVANVFLTSLKLKFDVIHTANPSDFYFPLTFFYKMLNKKIVFDHHDLCPELYLSRMNAKKDFFYKILKWSEYLSVKIADIVIATNESYKKINIDRNDKKEDDVFIVRNAPDLDRLKIVKPNIYLRKAFKYLVGYIGNMNPQDGLDYLLRIIKIVTKNHGLENIQFILMGDGDALKDLKKMAEKLNIEQYVIFTGRVSNEDVNINLSTVDVCVSPDPSNPLNDYSTWCKIMEYMFFAKPIVSFGLNETRYSAQKASLYAYNNDEKDFARKLVYLLKNKENQLERGNYGKRRLENKLSWDISKNELVKAYKYLFIK